MKRSVTVLSVAALTALACVCGGLEPGSPDKVGRCSVLPKSFQESDLVGTWTARYAHGTDTLILKGDGTYKQIYDDPQTGDHYESDWQEWWVERRESGIAYLHLNGMLKCDGRGCQRTHGADWFDFCEGRSVSMHGQVILLVIGTPANRVEPPHAVELWQLSENPDTFPSPFVFQP